MATMMELNAEKSQGKYLEPWRISEAICHILFNFYVQKQKTGRVRGFKWN